MKLLLNHTSPDTAYVVQDYPYGFTLRCKIRYWLEFSRGRGVRFASQTTNPKKAGDVWNKPKYSTYCDFGGAMYLDDQNHVQWTSLHQYKGVKETLDWQAAYGAANHPENVQKTQNWIKAKLVHDFKCSKGFYSFSINGIPGEPIKPELDWEQPETLALLK
jgi:hypothetical protein